MDAQASATVDVIDHIFRDVIGQVPGFEVREQQVELARKVMEGLASGRHVLSEAGTGTGKSLALMVPAVLHAKASNGTVIVSTGTINLQEQYVKKDLPFLQEVLKKEGIEFTFELAKGKNHYLCLDKFDEEVKAKTIAEDTQLILWALETKDGDDATLPPGVQNFSRVAADESCTSSDCRYFQQCFYFKARARWKMADILVVNHTLLLLDLKLRAQTGGQVSFLPDAVAYIFDEAHHLEAEARQVYGDEVTNFTIPWTVSRLQKIVSSYSLSYLDPEQHLQTVRKANEELFMELLSSMKGNIPQAVPKGDKIREKLARLDAEVSAIVRIYGAYGRVSEEERAYLSDHERQLKQRIRLLVDALESQFEALQRILAAEDEGYVYWMEQDTRPQVFLRLHATPVNVADILREVLFSKKPTVLTSATLAIDDGFEYVMEQLGIDDAIEIIVGSPFNYEENAVLYVPKNMPHPTKENDAFMKRAVEEIRRLVDASRGRALILFTSWKAMREAVQALSDLPYPVRSQDDGIQRGQLLEWFKTTPNAVLLATQSFWEGVDVPGDQLVLVVIDRLPFDPPTDPVVRRISEMIDAQGGSSFYDFAIPRAAVRLKQGLGRLIRTRTDRGVMTVLDSRIAEAQWRGPLLRSLPPARRTRRFETVLSFFETEKAGAVQDAS